MHDMNHKTVELHCLKYEHVQKTKRLAQHKNDGLFQMVKYELIFCVAAVIYCHLLPQRN